MGVNVPQHRSNWCANFQLKGSEIMQTAARSALGRYRFPVCRIVCTDYSGYTVLTRPRLRSAFSERVSQVSCRHQSPVDCRRHVVHCVRSEHAHCRECLFAANSLNMYLLYIMQFIHTRYVRRAPGRPRNSWIMQIGNGSPLSIRREWKKAQDHGHRGESSQRTSAVFTSWWWWWWCYVIHCSRRFLCPLSSCRGLPLR